VVAVWARLPPERIFVLAEVVRSRPLKVELHRANVVLTGAYKTPGCPGMDPRWEGGSIVEEMSVFSCGGGRGGVGQGGGETRMARGARARRRGAAAFLLL
jgi:hypothetical protein